MTDFFVITNPADIRWYQNLFDVMVLAIIVVAVLAAVRGWKQGRRDYAVLLVVAPVYALAIELSGMMTHKSYLQGEFTVMFNTLQWDIFKDSTNVPSYVPLFYPAFLFFGYKLTETFGIASPVRRALAGGFIMGLLDVTYIIQGGLEHVVWWTWRPFEMYQLWQGWPAADFLWEMSWHGFLFWMLYKVTPRINRWYQERPDQAVTNGLKTLLGVPVVLMLTLMAVGTVVLFLPLAALNAIGLPHWPFVAAVFVVLFGLWVTAEKHWPDRPDGVVVALAVIYVGAFIPMLVGNLLHEGGITVYLVAQAAALAMIAGLASYPRWRRRPVEQATAEQTEDVAVPA